MGDFRARKKPPPRGEGVAGLRGERPLVAQVEFVHAPRLRQSIGAAHMCQLDELADIVPEQRGTTPGAHFCLHVALVTRDHHLNAHGLVRHCRRAPCIPAINGRAVEREGFRVNVARCCAGFCCVCHAHDPRPFPRAPQVSHAKDPLAVRPGGPSGVGERRLRRVATDVRADRRRPPFLAHGLNLIQHGRSDAGIVSPNAPARCAEVRIPDSLDAGRAVTPVHVVARRVDMAAPRARSARRVNVARVGAGFCCVCHAHDPTGEPPIPQPHAASNSQAALPSPLVRSSLSGMLPTLAELDAQLLAPTTTSAASDIPRAHRMVVPATVYTWHTAAQVLRPASDMPHGSGRLRGRRTCPRGRRAGHP